MKGFHSNPIFRLQRRLSVACKTNSLKFTQSYLSSPFLSLVPKNFLQRVFFALGMIYYRRTKLGVSVDTIRYQYDKKGGPYGPPFSVSKSSCQWQTQMVTTKQTDITIPIQYCHLSRTQRDQIVVLFGGVPKVFVGMLCNDRCDAIDRINVFVRSIPIGIPNDLPDISLHLAIPAILLQPFRDRSVTGKQDHHSPSKSQREKEKRVGRKQDPDYQKNG